MFYEKRLHTIENWTEMIIQTVSKTHTHSYHI